MEQAGYWPWWLGAIGLSAVALGYYLLFGKLLGVSGAYLRLVHLRAERRADRVASGIAADPAAFAQSLEAATAKMLAEHPELAADLKDESPEAAPPVPQAAASVEAARSPWTANLALLLGLVAGGAMTLLWRGGPPNLLAPPVALFAKGWSALPILVVGGGMVGFGACLAGGCTSGHGLCGCSRFQPGSLLATASLMGAAVALSLFVGGAP